MKKLILLAFSIATIVYSYGNVNAETTNTKLQTVELSQTLQDPVEVKLADLPEAVQKTIAVYQKNGWEASETAYLITNKEDNSQHYEVAMKSKTTGKKVTIKIDKEGKELN